MEPRGRKDQLLQVVLRLPHAHCTLCMCTDTRHKCWVGWAVYSNVQRLKGTQEAGGNVHLYKRQHRQSFGNCQILETNTILTLGASIGISITCMLTLRHQNQARDKADEKETMKMRTFSQRQWSRKGKAWEENQKAKKKKIGLWKDYKLSSPSTRLANSNKKAQRWKRSSWHNSTEAYKGIPWANDANKRWATPKASQAQEGQWPKALNNYASHSFIEGMFWLVSLLTWHSLESPGSGKPNWRIT